MVLKRNELEQIMKDTEGKELNTKAKILMEARTQMFDILKNDKAEYEGYAESYKELKKGDETTLGKLKTRLYKEREKFSEDLGKVKERTDKDLKDDKALFDFLDKNIVTTLENAPQKKNEDLKKKIEDVINEIEKIETVKNGKFNTVKLFGGLTRQYKKDTVLGENRLEDIFGKRKVNTTNKQAHTKLQSLIHTGNEPFDIKPNNLLEDKDQQVARRISIMLYGAFYVCDHAKTKIDPAIEGEIQAFLQQIQNKEIGNLRGIHNTETEIRRVEPVYERLKALNLSKSFDLEIDPAGKKTTWHKHLEYNLQAEVVWNNFDLEKNFTQDEKGNPLEIQEAFTGNKEVFTKIDQYDINLNQTLDTTMDYKKVTGADGQQYEISIGNGNSIAAPITSRVDENVYITYHGQKIKIGTVTIDNTIAGAGKFGIELTRFENILADAGTDDIKNIFPIDIVLPLTGIKNSKHGAKAARLKRLIVHMGTAGEIITPPPTPIPKPVEEEGELEPVELTATISDTTKITRAIAERQAGEKLRKIYKNTARYKPRSRPTKATLFLGRGYMKDHYTRKYLNMRKGMQRDENLVKGADRHEMELENNFKNLDKIATIDETNYPETYKEIQVLKDELIQGAISPEDFKKDFKSIIEDNTLDASNPVSKIIKENDIQQMSSNVVEDVLAFRDHQKLVTKITTYMWQHPAIIAQDPVAESDFNIFARKEIVKYFKDYQKNPAFLKTLNIKLDDPDAMKQLSNLQAHHGALTMIAKQTMMLKVQILAKGEEAYDVKQDIKGFGGGMTKVGNRLDKPISDDSRFGKWLEKHPFVKNAFGTLRGITKLGAMITPAILLAPLGPLAVAGGAGGMAAIKTLFKKYAHYNKEHIGYQRNQANNILNNRAERNRLMNEMSKMNPASRFMRYYFGLGKKARDVRQFRDYVMTTHDQLENSKTLASKIDNLLKKPQLTNTEPRQLEDAIGQALARLNFHKKTGQNFLGSENKDEAEKEYQTIYRLVLTGAMRLDRDLSSFETTRTYKKEMDIIENGTGDPKKQGVNEIGYQKSRKRFKHRQTEKALLGAVKAGGLAFGLSYLATSLASTNASTHTHTGSTGVKENFVLGGHETGTVNGVYTPAKTFFDAPATTGQNVAFPYGGGTDATHVLAGKLTPAEYATKLAEVTRDVTGMAAINPTTKANLLAELGRQPWLPVTGQTNAVLHNMRCIEGIQQIAHALNDSTNAANIIIAPTYTPTVFDITATTYNNAAERVVQGALNYSQDITTPGNFIPIPIPAYMNTFKEPDRYGEERDQRNNEDRQGRKTRSPAPKVDKNPEDNMPPRRRSGENTEETRFTHSNN